MDISPSAAEIFDRPQDLTTEELDIIYRDYEAERALSPDGPLTPAQLRDLDYRTQIRVLQRRVNVLTGMLRGALSLCHRLSARRG